ncbi:Uncharacterised protein [Eikenella corrodens]|uniref:Cytoplasmic protein n=2 Tax=Eikenella corrodens TaxID=539 RepID=A0A8B4GE74_EIKCO|nr:Uncharacterised protein [Eikenella corrodens]
MPSRFQVASSSGNKMTNLSTDEALGAAAIAAHQFSFKNKAYLLPPQRCGCFSCLAIFRSTELEEGDFVPENDGQYTACCPYCGIDSVIGENCGYAITPELLAAMQDYWF